MTDAEIEVDEGWKTFKDRDVDAEDLYAVLNLSHL